MERRLAAILYYDVVGYGRAMGEDEAGTLERLKAHRREVIDLKAAQHGAHAGSAAEALDRRACAE